MKRIVFAAMVMLGCTGLLDPPQHVPPAPPSASAPASAPSHDGDSVWGTVKLGSGELAPHALVALIPHFELEYAGDPPDVPLAVADEQGRYRFEGVAPGRYGLTATSAGGAAAYGGVHELKAGEPLHVELTLGADPVNVVGRVRDSEGKAVPNARIMAARMSEDEGDVYVARASADGAYALALPSGPDYFLVVDALPSPRSYRRIEAKAQAANFDLEPAPPPRPPDAEIAKALAAQAVPIATLEPEHGVKDLEALRTMIGDARIVAVGEATHGSREFFLARRRLLELLVEQMGFTVLAVEAGWSDAIRTDEHIRTEKDSANLALTDLYYWAINTEEMVGAVEWMRRYNHGDAHKKKLRFRGFDIEFTPHAVAAVLAYVAKVDAKGAAVTELLAPLKDVSAEQKYAGLDKAVLDRTAKGIADLLQRFDAQKKSWAAKSSEEAWTIARHHAELLQKTEALYRTSDGRTGRDAAMADNVTWILDHEPPGTKIVLWAHNSHLAAQATQGSDMGERLRAKYGKDYFVMGVTFGSGAFHALDWSNGPQRGSGVGTVTLGAPPAASLEGALGAAKMPLFALDLRAVSGPLGAWLDSKIPMRHVGGVFRGENIAGVRCAPKKSFDALVYIDKVTASHVNPGAN